LPFLVIAVLLAACGDDEGPASGALDAMVERDGNAGAGGGTSDGPPTEEVATDAGQQRDGDNAEIGQEGGDVGVQATTDATTADATSMDASTDMTPVDASPEVANDAPLDVASDVRATTDASMSDATPDRPAPSDAGGGDAADATTLMNQHVHVLISNTCVVGASPQSFAVPRGQTLRLSWHNHSVDYDADVWLSYGGGYLGLKTGDVWDDRFEFCTGPRPYMAYGDVGIAGGGGSVCPSFRVWIACQ
jgi:hypothetical protein